MTGGGAGASPASAPEPLGSSRTPTLRGSALLIIDVQNDFCPGGSLAVPEGDRVVPELNAAIDLYHQAGRPVIASRDWHPRQTTHFAQWGGKWPPHCVQGTVGAAFHAALQLPPEAIVVSKGTAPDADSYSAFEARTEGGEMLAELLRRLGVHHLQVGGLATDYCVKSSVLDARHAGFSVEVLTRAVRGVELQPGDSARALEAMEAAGARLA
ncbi:MAG: bifunctional nicotinamidase/pyrazinamidase [Candidatus Xenobia bacterium]